MPHRSFLYWHESRERRYNTLRLYPEGWFNVMTKHALALLAALLAAVSFGLTLAVLFEGVRWLPLASLCYCALALLIDMTERGSRFIPFE